jgi:hypothetical protein
MSIILETVDHDNPLARYPLHLSPVDFPEGAADVLSLVACSWKQK